MPLRLKTDGRRVSTSATASSRRRSHGARRHGVRSACDSERPTTATHGAFMVTRRLQARKRPVAFVLFRALELAHKWWWSGMGSSCRPSAFQVARKAQGCLTSIIRAQRGSASLRHRQAARRPGRHWRGCCGRARWRGGSHPGPARSRRGYARIAGWPRPAARLPGRRQRGYCGRSGCLGGSVPGPARSRRGCAPGAG